MNCNKIISVFIGLQSLKSVREKALNHKAEKQHDVKILYQGGETV